MSSVVGRRLIAFNPTYGYPEEVSDFDIVKLAQVNLTGIGGVGLNAQGQSITGLPAPVSPSDAVNLQYVNGIAQGISCVASVQALSIANVASLSGAQTIDSVACVAGNRVLLVGQSTGSQNGVWVVRSGAWTRPTNSPDYLTGASAAGRFCFVEGGSVYAKQGWVCTNQPGSDVVDTSALTFTQFTGVGEDTAGNGIAFNLNTISVALAQNSGLQFTNACLDHLLQPTGSLVKDVTGIGLGLSGTTLSNTGQGLAVLGLPANFTVGGANSHVDANVTAANLNVLVDGNSSAADGLHTHKSVISAQTTAAVHNNGSVALNAGDPVGWSPTADVLMRGDATVIGTSTVIGVAMTAIAASTAGIIVKRGVVTGVLSGATPGAVVYLAVGGGLTQVIPTAASAALMQVGFAKNATDLDVSIDYVGRRAPAAQGQ